ncbi:DUF3320 domain-containing protein [Promicromonospora sp. NPDC057138]|uniref:DUF3320 domain-containing protein n=1 Tax=Promicromonospora sp. NPDC057138 TaxID=3346031 RepID=UPI00363BCD41
MSQSEFAAALNVWRDGLVTLSGTNRLIRFRPSRTGSVQIDAPSADEIVAALNARKLWTLEGDPEPSDSSVPLVPEPPGAVLHSPRPDKDLGPVLRNLMRRAEAEYLDRGLSVLYLAFGMLHWKDVDDSAMVSPLLLVPVALVPQGPKGTPRLGAGEDDAVINPALALRLRELNIELPDVEMIDGMSVAEVLETVAQSLATSKDTTDWEIRPSAYLSTFSFAKEAMVRDLQENEEQILAHPIVQALATSDPTKQSAEFIFDPIEPADIDRLAPPENTPLVLDADSSQRAAVAASIDGKTFVMDGPPGTGKSQTIANMIGALLHAGKTVLFVSEKIAALDVVRNRLADAGLGNYLLELHSHKASRKEVATELTRALDNETVPPKGMDAISRADVADRRKGLNAYAEAMNTVQQPLNMSLHHVLGLLAQYEHLPSAPIPEQPLTDLSQEQYREIQGTERRLQRAWRPAAQGRSFLWRNVIDETSLEIRLSSARDALEQLRGTVELNADVALAFGLDRPNHTPTLAALTSHQHNRPGGVLQAWLTADDWPSLVNSRTLLGTQLARITAAERAVVDYGGVVWTDLPPTGSVPERPEPIRLSVAALDLEQLHEGELTEVADRFEATSRRMSEQLRALGRLSDSLGMATATTYPEIDRVAAVVRLRKQAKHPDRRWFSPEGLLSARTAGNALHARVAALSEAESTASARFADAALRAPLAELQDRFTNLHKGLKKLSGTYRADKRTVASLLTSASTVKEGIQHLTEAIAWSARTREFEAAVIEHSPILGTHWHGRETDFESLARAIAVAEQAATLAGGRVPSELADFLSTHGPDDGQNAIVDAVTAEFDTWKSGLAPAPRLTGRPELVLAPVQVSIDWLLAHVGPMRQAAERIGAVMAVTRKTHTLMDANRLLELREKAAAAHRALQSKAESYRASFDEHYNGTETNLAALDSALRWAEQTRQITRGSLSIDQIRALESSHHVENLQAAYDKWTSVRDRIVDAFARTRRTDLLSDLDDYTDAFDLIDNLQMDSIGQQEWFDYIKARTDLQGYGLEPAIEYCIDHQVESEQVPHVLERSLLRGWADMTIHLDADLQPALAMDRDSLVQEYRNLDQQLLVNATSEIIRSANARRPERTTLGEPALIRRQGMLKRKHKPVRDLIRETRNTSLAIKPCFMMSPLAVSQYLPPDMSFDVVIFDEASQVTPGDAINCVYRGKALILAGDDKQLPPTSFFERVVDDEGNDETDVADFQSILELAKGAGAFPNLGLRWHYRSRHEDLIAFSNYKFYEGKLVTYPSSHAEGDDVGVAFYNANGTYRRGGGADNPTEAAKVAERVIEHFTNRPDLTLGVVTFSIVQADAVIAALDQARESRRDLDRFFDTGDRLNGFFVRSLESVQGDERDVIIFSIGYGPDEAGKVTTNFGVLNKPKGWRRLNVAATRARQRVEVVASMRAGDIPPSTNENVEHLRAYLDYAERGTKTLALEYGPSGLEPDSPFEESVIKALRSWGYTVDPQVGAAGFRIDIGVRHPAHPGMYAIGIECDGYQYHSAPAARDRDRLREQILRGLGWELHRIWGTSWYRHRHQEEERLRAAIERAIATPAENRHRKPSSLERPEISTVAVEGDGPPTWTTEYQVAPPKRLPYWVDAFEAADHWHLREPLTALVDVEGPVHLDVVFERIRAWWDIGRVSARLRTNIKRAARETHTLLDGDFLDVPGRPIDKVRTPTRHMTRKVEHVHIGELTLAAQLLLRDAGAADRSGLVVGVARIFGWTRTGALVDQRINGAIDQLLSGGARLDDLGRLHFPDA